jgi:hypothetical protein
MAILKRRSVRWFLLAGCIGVGVAIILGILKPANPLIVVFLCPTAIVGLADPKGLLETVVVALIIFGGNFLLYGVFGAIAGVAAGQSYRDGD